MSSSKVKHRTMMKRLSASVSELLGGRKSSQGLDETMSSLHHAILLGNVQLIRLILQSPNLHLEATDSKGCGPLHWAANCKREVVELLLQHQLDPDVQDGDGNTPLHLMAREGNVDAVSGMLYEAADAGIVNGAGKTAFDVAAEFGRYQVGPNCSKVAEVLLASDWGPAFLRPSLAYSETERAPFSGLHLAARNGHLDVMHLLLESGMDVNESVSSGTALHEAAKHCQLHAARLLLFMGADPESRNAMGQTPADLLKKYTGKHLAVAKEINTLLKLSEGSCYAESIVAHYGTGPDQLSFPVGATIWVVEQEGRKCGPDSWQGVILGPKGTTRAGAFPPTAVKLTTTGRSTMQRGPQRQAKKVGLPSLPSDLPPPPNGIQPQTAGSAAEENPDLKASLAEAKAVSSGHAGMLAAVRSPRHRASTGSNYSHSSSSGFESLKGGRMSKAGATTPSIRGPSPSHSQSRHSLHSGSSSSGTADSIESGLSLERLDESGYASQVNIAEMITNGAPDADVIGSWLAELRLDEYLPLFLDAGYDLPSLVRMTPEDLTAIGISKPPHRKRITNEIHRLKQERGDLSVGDPWPSSEPAGGLTAWLAALRLPSEYGALFQKEGFHTIAQVKSLTWEDFADLGISKLGHLKRLELGIKKLKAGAAQQPSASPFPARWTAEVRPYSHLPQPPSTSQYQPPQLLSSGAMSPRAGGQRAPSPGLTTFGALNGRPYSPQLSHRPAAPGYDTFPRRGFGAGSEVVTAAQIHEHDKPVGSVRPQPYNARANGGSLCRRSSSCEADDVALAKESHYANLPGLPTSPRIRLNLHSPARQLSDGGLRKAPPPPPPKRADDKKTTHLFPESELDMSEESILSSAPSLDCLPPPVIRCEESMRNLRALVSKRSSEEPTSSTETLPFANDNCGTIRSRHSPSDRPPLPPSHPPTAHSQSQPPGEHLTDLGDMLQNLTDELDALLVPAN